MEILRTLLQNKDYNGAKLVMEAINLQDPPIIADPTIGEYADANSEATHQSVQNALASTGALGGGQQEAPVTPPPQQGMPTGQSQPMNPQQGNAPPRAAATLFTNV